MQDNLTRQFIRFGLIYASIRIGFELILYLIGADFTASHFVMLPVILLFIFIACTIVAIRNFRKSNGENMTFKEGFKFTFFMLAFAGLIITAFSIIFYGLINQEYATIVTEKTIDNMAEWMRSLGSSETDIEKMIERNNSNATEYTVGGQIRGYLLFLIFYAIYAAILGAIFQRNKTPFEPQVG